MITAKLMLRSLVPPALWRLGQVVAGRERDRFEYLADAVAAHARAGDEQYWSQFIAQERIACQALMTRARANTPLISSNPDEDLKYAIFGYAIAIAALEEKQVTVLDYGGNLGEFFWLARTLVQGVEIDFHCKELPAIADVGRALNPQVTWHTDNSCLTAAYDLVMFNSSIQYVTADTLFRAARAGRHLLLSDVPAVRNVPAFFSTQSRGNWATVQRHPNVSEIIATVEGAGLRLVREIDMGPHPHVRGAPEQPVCVGWFFQRV